jgi:hypothetical protein
VLHAVWRHFDLDSEVDVKDRQEHKVASIANGLTQVFNDNPEFYKWVGEQLGHSK